MPAQRRTSTRSFERPKRYIVIDPKGNRIAFDNAKDMIDFGENMKKGLQPDFKRQLDSLSVVEKQEKINEDRKVSPFKTMLDSLNVVAKERDIKKPYYKPPDPSHTPELDRNKDMLARYARLEKTRQLTPREQSEYEGAKNWWDQFGKKANGSNTDPDYTDATRLANLSGLLNATVESDSTDADGMVIPVRKNKVTGPARKTVQDQANSMTAIYNRTQQQKKFKALIPKLNPSANPDSLWVEYNNGKRMAFEILNQLKNSVPPDQLLGVINSKLEKAGIQHFDYEDLVNIGKQLKAQ